VSFNELARCLLGRIGGIMLNKLRRKLAKLIAPKPIKRVKKEILKYEYKSPMLSRAEVVNLTQSPKRTRVYKRTTVVTTGKMWQNETNTKLGGEKNV
jgi:hypothetical protein